MASQNTVVELLNQARVNLADTNMTRENRIGQARVAIDKALTQLNASVEPLPDRSSPTTQAATAGVLAGEAIAGPASSAQPSVAADQQAVATADGVTQATTTTPAETGATAAGVTQAAQTTDTADVTDATDLAGVTVDVNADIDVDKE